MANKLDSSEDHLGRGTAITRFHDVRMGRLRGQALADVDEEWRAKRLRWQNVKRIIKHSKSGRSLTSMLRAWATRGTPMK